MVRGLHLGEGIPPGSTGHLGAGAQLHLGSTHISASPPASSQLCRTPALFTEALDPTVPTPISCQPWAHHHGATLMPQVLCPPTQAG